MILLPWGEGGARRERREDEGVRSFRVRAQLVEARAAAPEAEAFEQACLAYLAFGRANQGVYRLMFASHILSGSQDEALDRAGSAAFECLLQGVSHYVPPERVQTTA